MHYFQTFDCVESHPKIFNKLGYHTQIVAKLHVGPPRVYPFSIRNENHTRDGKWIADRLEECITRCQQEDVPFFSTVGFIDPHRDGSRGGFGNKKDWPSIEKHECDPKDVHVPDFVTDLPEVRQELAGYYQAIDRMDQAVGMLMELLDRKGVADSTLVMFVSDNGPPWVNSKTTLYESGVRLPMLIRCPGKKAGTRNPNLVSYIDILPTVLDWAGHKDVKSQNPPGTERIGRSILPIVDLEQEHQDWAQVFCSHTFHETSSYYPTRVLRTRNYKYHRNISWQTPFPFGTDLYGALSFEAMRNHQPEGPGAVKIGKRPLKDFIHRPAEMLFDIKNDPMELDNLADKPEYQDKLLEMRKTMEQWQKDTGDQWLFKDGLSLGLVGRHIMNGCKVPDRFDFDVDNPGTEDCLLVKKQDRIHR